MLLIVTSTTYFNLISRYLTDREMKILLRNKEARKCLWNDERLQRRIFNGVGKLRLFATLLFGLYFKGTCDVIAVTMATRQVHKKVF